MGTGRRGWAAAGMSILVALTMAGCGKPAGTDGDLTDDWSAFAEAKTPVPVVGSCYTQDYAATWSGPFNPVSCSTEHETETSYVGTFTGSDADRSAPPDTTSAGRKTAYTTCGQKTNDYLGADWHTGYAWMGLVLPSDAAWTGGARWFRCDVAKTDDVEYHTVQTDSSLKDGLLGEKPLAITCLNTVENSSGQVESETPASCGSPHNAEMAGISVAPDTAWPGETAIEKKADTACEGVVARYLGFSNGKDQNATVGWLFFWPREEQWNAGDRTYTCFAYAFTKSKKMTGSVKGLGSKAPKG